MNTEKITKNAVSAWRIYKNSDPVMLRKTFCMRDSLYRESCPDKELWRSDFSFDCSFYAAVIAAILILAGAAAVTCAAWHTVCRPFRKKRR